MAKLTLNDLTNLRNENSVVTKLNNNNTFIETALENTLSRDGTSPNAMNADLDMNGNQILNLPAATSDAEPVRKAEFDDAIDNIASEVLALSTEGIVIYSFEDGATTRTFEAVGGSGITITNGDGVDGNPTFDFDTSQVEFTPPIDAIGAVTPAADTVPYFTGTTTAAVTPLTSFARTLLDDADATTARTTLGAQASDAELSALAGLTSAADKVPYFTGSGTASTADFTSFGRSLVDDADATAARTTLGVVIGTNVQAQDAELAALAGLTSGADKLPYFTGSGTAGLADFTTYGRSLVDDADASTARTTLGLVIGTNVQAQDAELSALAGLTSAADKGIQFTGAGTAATYDLTAFAKTVLDDADAATARTTLGAQPLDATLTALAGVTTAADKVIYSTGIDTFTTTDFTSTARNLLDDGSTSAMRTTLGLAIGTDVQAQNAVLQDLAGLTQATDKLIYFDSSTTAATADLSSFGRTLIDDAAASNARTTLGLVIGTDVQAHDAQLDDFAGLAPTKGRLAVADGTNWTPLTVGTNDQVLTAASAETTGIKWADAPGAGGGLANAYDTVTDGTNSASASGGDDLKFRAGTALTVVVGSNDGTHGDNVLYSLDADLVALAGVTSAADALPYFTGSGTATTTTLSSYGRSLIDDADASTARTTLGLVIGTNVQAQDAELAAIAGLTSANDRLPYFTGSGTASLATFTTAGRNLIDDADAAAQRTTLGLAAVAASGSAADLSTGTLPSARLSAADTTYGIQEIWIPATAMYGATTNGAASGAVETTTNKVMLKTLDFDTTTQEFAQFAVAFPKQWNEGTVTFAPYWSHPSTTTNFGVVFQLQGVSLANDDAQDTAFGTAQTSTDTGGTTNDLYIGPTSSAITIAGTPAAQELVYFRVARVPANGSDTMAVDARLHGIKLFITTDAGNDT